jgi:hypothetical protein
MDYITFRCTSCKQGLKVGADKAGRKVKCTKCGTALTVPDPSAPKPAPKPSTAKGLLDEDEDSGGIYGVEGLDTNPKPAAPAAPARSEQVEDQRPSRRRRFRDEDDEEEDEDEDEETQEEKDEALLRRLRGEDEEEDEEDEEEYEDDEDRPRRTRRRGMAKLDPPAWQRIRVGTVLAVVAAGLTAAAAILHGVYVLIGAFAGSQYAQTVNAIHPNYQATPEEQAKDLDMPKLLLALVGGLDGVDGNRIMVIISQVLEILEYVVLIAAFALCLGVPARFGAKGIALTGLVLAGVNLIITVVFKLLAQLGAMKYVLVPLLGAELPMLDANADRLDPLHIIWADVPYLQVLLTVFILALNLGQLAFFPLFLRAVSFFVKSERLERTARALVEMALGVVFIYVAYQMLAIAGASDVLGWALRAVYLLGLGFLLGQLIWFIVVCLKSRTIIQEALDEQ